MTRLRVMSGLHKGAATTLTQSVCTFSRLGAGALPPGPPSQPLLFVDWDGPPATLEKSASAEGGYILRDAPSGSERSCLIGETFEAGGIRFTLEERGAGKKSAKPERRRSSAMAPASSGALALGAVMALGLITAGVQFASKMAGPAAEVHVRAQAQAQLDPVAIQASLAAGGYPDLSVRQEGDELVVSGLVRSTEEDRSVRELLSGMDAKDAQNAWHVASHVAATIESAIALPGISVAYQGAGRFLISGATDAPDKVAAVVRQLQSDLAGQGVQTIDMDVTKKQTLRAVSSRISAGPFGYAQLTDGTKTFTPQEEPGRAKNRPTEGAHDDPL